MYTCDCEHILAACRLGAVKLFCPKRPSWWSREVANAVCYRLRLRKCSPSSFSMSSWADDGRDLSAGKAARSVSCYIEAEGDQADAVCQPSAE